MNNHPQSSRLHIPELTIRGFKCINELTLSDLGRVNLIVGKNSIGKTTVLDAIQLLVSRSKVNTVRDLMLTREELEFDQGEETEDYLICAYESMFYGHNPDQDSEFIIRLEKGNSSLTLTGSLASPRDVSRSLSDARLSDIDVENAHYLEMRSPQESSPFILSPVIRARRGPNILASGHESKTRSDSKGLNCLRIGPYIPSNSQVAHYWDKIALTEEEDITVYALSIALNVQVERVSVIDDRNNLASSRRTIVKLCGKEPVPLQSLGEGARRLFATALALTNCAGGILLIDEVENGVHHTIQNRYWDMILSVASKYDIQVFATTHSFDSIVGFARVAVSSSETAILHRLETKNGHLRAVRYTEESLKTAADCNIEMR